MSTGRSEAGPCSAVRVRLVVLVAFVFLFSLLWAVSADALVVHKFQRSFGSAGSGLGQFNEPWGVAVNDSTGLAPAAGDVYVVDSGNNRVERFSASGLFLGWFDGSGTYEVEGKGKKRVVPRRRERFRKSLGSSRWTIRPRW